MMLIQTINDTPPTFVLLFTLALIIICLRSQIVCAAARGVITPWKINVLNYQNKEIVWVIFARLIAYV